MSRPVVPAPQGGGDLLLPRPPGILRRFLARHETAVDVAIALIVLGLELLQSLSSQGLGLQGDLLLHGTWPLVLLGAAGVAFRRSRPRIAIAVVVVASVALVILDRPFLAVAALVCIYAIAVHRSVREAWIAAGATLVLTFGVGQIISVLHGVNSLGQAVQSALGIGLMLTIAVLIGSNNGNRRRYLDALLERAAQLARERDQEGQLAAAAERARIAREMHDVVAHSLSVVVRLADGADAIADSDPDRSRETVRQIGEVGRESLRDMRRLLGVLRDGDPAALAPQPTLDELDHLVETYRGAGLPVVVRQTGAQPTDSPLQVAVYRAVQESLTNALRYSANPSRVLVRLDYEAEVTTVEVTDDGLFLGRPASVGTGRGLVGLRERAAVFGGAVEAGPRVNAETGQDGGGWRVHMTLPHAREETT